MKTLSMRHTTLALLMAAGLVSAPVWASGNHAHSHGPMDTDMKVTKPTKPIVAEETGFGRQGMFLDLNRTIDISMSDAMRFSPSSLVIKQGETIRFRIRNDGKIPHEFVLGPRDEIAEHAEMMKKNPEMEHADAHSARVAPGKTAEIIWQFTQPGTFLYACLIPGHWEAGMQGTVTVGGKSGEAPVAVAARDMKSTPATTKPLAMDKRYTTGEIRKVDMALGKLTIKHGEIKNLNMPGMTMLFRVKDPAMLKMVKAGDAVLFTVEKQGGALVITELKLAP